MSKKKSIFKKITGIVGTAILTTALFLPTFNSASAYTGGLLEGKVIQIGSSINLSESGSTGNYTDGDATTSGILGAKDSTSDTIWYKFTEPMDITQVYLDAELTNGLVFSFFNASGTDMGQSIVSPTDSTLVDHVVNDVTYVALINNNTTETRRVYEFDVLGNLSSASDTTAPSNVTSLSETHTDTDISLSYVLPTDSDFSHTNVYVNGVKDNGTNIIGTTYTISGLTESTLYDVVVKSVDTSGNESTGSSISVTTNATTTGDTTPPNNVTSLTHTVTDTTLDLSYVLPTDADFSHLDIFLDGIKYNTTPITATTYSITGLTPSTAYVVNVKSVDTTGNSSNGSTLNFSTTSSIDTVAPSVPTGVVVTTANAGLLVNWDDNSENDVSGYNVYVDGIKDNSTLISSSYYSINALSNDVSYAITVTAVDESGNESASTLSVTGIPLATAMPLIAMDYELVDVADGVASWFSSLWLIIAFSVAIPLSFLVSNRIKGLFLSN